MTAAKSLILAGALAALTPAAAAPPHSGQVVEDGFEASDVALFACAALGIWFARRSMRARARARRTPPSFVSSEVEKTELGTALPFLDFARNERHERSMDQLDALESTIRARMAADPGSSYVASLAAKGRAKIAQKVGEEAVETIIAALSGDKAALTSEATDLIFHLAILLADAGLSLDDVRAELARREGVSGLAEKASR